MQMQNNSSCINNVIVSNWGRPRFVLRPLSVHVVTGFGRRSAVKQLVGCYFRLQLLTPCLQLFERVYLLSYFSSSQDPLFPAGITVLLVHSFCAVGSASVDHCARL